MPKYELSIQLHDKPGPGAKRWDISSVFPHPCNTWGHEQLKKFLIVIVTTDRTMEEMQLLTRPMWRDLVENEIVTDEEKWARVDTLVKDGDYTKQAEQIRDEILANDPEADINLSELEYSLAAKQFEIHCKSSCSISEDAIKAIITDLNQEKLLDDTKIYQPFKKSLDLIQKFDGLNGRPVLGIDNVDTFSVKANANQEAVIDAKAMANVFYNKTEEAYEAKK